MSITTSAAPGAFTVPATVTARSASALCSCSEGALPALGTPPGTSVAIAAGFGNTVAGASSASLSAPGAGRGIRAGAIAATVSASTPTTRTGRRLRSGPVA
jgi:hypothetical protein